VSDVDAVLLIAFGGPEKPEDIRPFLRIVTEGRRIPPERIEEVAHHYEVIGGRSPLGELTRLQAASLRQALAREGDARPVYVGMRNWHPFLPETFAEMRARGHRRALGIILSSFQTEASWERYHEDVDAARARVGAGGARRGACRATGGSASGLHGAQRTGGDGGELSLRGAARHGGRSDRRATDSPALVGGLPEPERLTARAVARARHR
jgi:ferrochelatase